MALLCICLELLDVFVLVIAGCKRALHTQLEPRVVSGRKVTESYVPGGRGAGGVMRRGVLVTHL